MTAPARTDADPSTARYDQRLLLADASVGDFHERYSYDELGNIRRIERDVAPGQTYVETREYDNLNRLQRTVREGVELSVGAVGNSAANPSEPWPP
jgi:hypothetical protein